MKKLPAVVLASLILGFGYLSCADPIILEPHDPHLTPSLTATDPAVATDTPTSTEGPSPTASDTPTTTATPTTTNTPTSTATPTATSTSASLPTPTRIGTRHPAPTVPPPTPRTTILEVTQEDLNTLARLCVVEVRGMEEVREDACLGVISTVATRAYNRIISDGTIAGTIGWGCTADSDTCQFPAHVLGSGCDGLLPAACAWSYPNDIVYFRQIVSNYFEGQGGSCAGYIYYGITEQDPPECRLESDSGQFLNWHGRVP